MFKQIKKYLEENGVAIRREFKQKMLLMQDTECHYLVLAVDEMKPEEDFVIGCVEKKKQGKTIRTYVISFADGTNTQGVYEEKEIIKKIPFYMMSGKKYGKQYY